MFDWFWRKCCDVTSFMALGKITGGSSGVPCPRHASPKGKPVHDQPGLNPYKDLRKGKAGHSAEGGPEKLSWTSPGEGERMGERLGTHPINFCSVMFIFWACLSHWLIDWFSKPRVYSDNPMKTQEYINPQELWHRFCTLASLKGKKELSSI